MAQRRRNHITQADGSVIHVLSRSTWFTKAQIRIGRRFTAEERRAAEKARNSGALWTDFADELKAAEERLARVLTTPSQRAAAEALHSLMHAEG